ncbi:MAG: pentapeptide repeat-containing protein, partial [Nostoc sp.]
IRGVFLISGDLRGANLRGGILIGAILIVANLSPANVRNARFGYNQGISESIKRELIQQGAIFEDYPGDRTLSPRTKKAS